MRYTKAIDSFKANFNSSFFKCILNYFLEDFLLKYIHQLAYNSTKQIIFSPHFWVQLLLFIPKYSEATSYINKKMSILICLMRCNSSR